MWKYENMEMRKWESAEVGIIPYSHITLRQIDFNGN